MAYEEELDPYYGVPRITVRPEAPPLNDLPWGKPAEEGGRPMGRLFEPDLSAAESPVKAWARENLPRLDRPIIAGPNSYVGGALGSIAAGARGLGDWLGGRPSAPPAPSAPPDPTLAPREMWQQQYPSPKDPSLLQRGVGAIGTAAEELRQAPRNMFEGEIARMQPGVSSETFQRGREQAIGAAADVTSTLAGAGPIGASIRGVPMLGAKSNFGTFGSVMSAPQAKLDKLPQAQQMLKEGRDLSDVWKQTGWTFDKAGTPLHEISDQHAYFRGIPDKAGQPLVLEDVLHHPELYSRFPPQLRNMPVYVDPSLNAYGAYHRGNLSKGDLGFITLGEKALTDFQKRGEVFSTLLHEVTHPIQFLENMPKGGNPKAKQLPGSPADQLYQQAVAAVQKPEFSIEQWAEKFGKPVNDPVVAASYRNYVEDHVRNVNTPEFKAALREWAGNQNYDRGVGEIYAELAPTRQDYTDLRRMEIPPHIQERGVGSDKIIPREKQTVEYYTPEQRGLAGVSLPTREQLGFPPRQPGPLYTEPQQLSLLRQKGGAPQFGDILNPVLPEMRAKKVAGSLSVQSGVSPSSGAVPQVAERYPEILPPTQTYDPKTKNWFPQKTLSEEAQQVQKARVAAQRDIDAGNYTPYFDPSKRADVNPANYPEMTSTKDVVRPAKEKTRQKYEEMANTPEAKARLAGAYERGLQQKAGSVNWYFMKQLEDEFIKEYGATKGSAMFKERFADAMAATTGGADPTSNLMMAHYGNWLKARGEPVPPSHAFPFPIGGRYAGSNMGQFDKMIMQGHGISPTINSKRYNFSGNFTGYGQGATIDEQMMGLIHPGLQMPPAGSYGHFENVVHQAAKEAGVDPRYYQEVAWAGAKDEKTKGGFAAKPMIQIVNEAIERTHRITGMPRDEIVRRGLVRAEIPLYGAVGLLGGGAALGSIADPRNYQQ